MLEKGEFNPKNYVLFHIFRDLRQLLAVDSLP
jgi:hypothetical protein